MFCDVLYLPINLACGLSGMFLYVLRGGRWSDGRAAGGAVHARSLWPRADRAARPVGTDGSARERPRLRGGSSHHQHDYHPGAWGADAGPKGKIHTEISNIDML